MISGFQSEIGWIAVNDAKESEIKRARRVAPCDHKGC
jgi:hypothetical protein